MSEAVVAAIVERFSDAVVSTHSWRGDDTVVVKRDKLVEIAQFLKSDPDMDFKLPVDVCGVDYLGKQEPRFEVVYHFASITHRHRIRVKVQVSEDPAECWVPTLTGVWRGVNWFEREVWDMYGVRIQGHPKHQRILLYEEFEGHALRKDYPQRAYQPLMPMPTLPREQ